MPDAILRPAGAASAHVDTFARDHLPPPELWPALDYTGLPELAYPPRLNCAAELLDRVVAAGHGERTAILAPGTCWTYRELLEAANRIAGVLRDDLGLVPGNRVLLRGPNNPMMAACWLAVLKAGRRLRRHHAAAAPARAHVRREQGAGEARAHRRPACGRPGGRRRVRAQRWSASSASARRTRPGRWRR